MGKTVKAILAMLLVILLASSCTRSELVNVQLMYVVNTSDKYGYALKVKLEPTSEAQANKQYIVDLYEKGKLRDSTYVEWTQSELNVQHPATVEFGMSADEFDAYYFTSSAGLSHIFSVKVHT